MARREGGAVRICRDVYVPNESDGIVFTSRSLAGSGLMPGERSWREAVGRGDLLPLSVEREDGFVVRVVVGDLEEREDAEWVGRLTAPLRLPDGALAISGGIEKLTKPGTIGASQPIATPVLSGPIGRCSWGGTDGDGDDEGRHLPAPIDSSLLSSADRRRQRC
jgi:hypothetical protein